MPPTDSTTNLIQLYQDFLHFMQNTLHLDSLNVIGNSMGGSMAWYMAADSNSKVKKLVLLNAAGYEMDQIVKKNGNIMTAKELEVLFEKGMPVQLSEHEMTRCFAVDSKITEQDIRIAYQLCNREGNIHAAWVMASSGQFPDSSLITHVTCPTLIVWGREDIVLPMEHAEKFHRDIKNSRVIIYDSCGHVPMIEIPEKLTPDVRAFFRE